MLFYKRTYDVEVGWGDDSDLWEWCLANINPADFITVYQGLVTTFRFRHSNDATAFKLKFGRHTTCP